MKSREEVFQIILGYFKVVNIINGVARCICPGHSDDKPSLHISMGDKKIILDCKAGCSYKDILNVVGLKPEQLYYDYYTADRRVSQGQHYYKRKCEAEYILRRIDTGEITHYKYRMPGKDFKQGHYKNGIWISNLQDVDTSLSIFSNCEISKLKQSAQNGEIIAYFEGERDTLNGRKYGLIGLTCGNVSDWNRHRKVFEYIKGAKLIVFADDDENDSGLNNSNRLKKYFESLGGRAAVIVPAKGMNIKGGDFTDYMKCHTQDDLNKLIDNAFKSTVTEKIGESNSSELSLIEVKSMLSYDEHGKVLQTVKNFEVVLENDSRFVGKFGFNEFSRQMSLTGSVPWEPSNNSCRAWNNHDDSALFSILQSDYTLRGRNDYFDAIRIVSMKNQFHPVRNMLDSLVWKGTGHIQKLLPDYLGVEDTEYQHQVLKLWMLGAVSRIYKPGCKFDYTLILIGPQGLGKSTFLRLMALMDEWFNDSLDNLDSDKTAQSLMGSWIIELAELKSLARTSGGVDSIKRFLTAQQDKYRAPYERRAEIIQRQCVFAGTTNRTDFLQDESGNRRFLIVETGLNEPAKSLFAPEAMEDIKAAWAEAVHIMKSENPKLVLPEECQKEAERLQAASMLDDGKTGLIEAYLENKQRTCAIEIWQEALNEAGRPAKWQAGEINNIVSSLPGWRKMKSPGRFGEFGMQRGFEFVDKIENVDKGFVNVDNSMVSELPFN